MLRKETIGRVFTIFSIAIVLLTAISGAVAFRPVSAQADPGPSPSEYAKKYQAAAHIGYCIQRKGVRNDRSLNDLNEMKVIDDGGLIDTEGEYLDHKVGWLTEPSDDGSFRCASDDDKKALDILGVPGSEIFIESGIYRVKANSAGLELTDMDNAGRANAFVAYISQKIGVNVSADPMPAGSRYYNLLATFEKKCDGGKYSTGTKVKIVDANGVVTEETYILKDNDQHNIGFGYAGIEDSDGLDMSCSRIVQELNATADAAATAQKEWIAKGGDPATDGSSPDSGASDDGQSTCEASGNPLSWILCPIFNGVAELTDWIYRTLIEPFLVTAPVSTDPNSESFKVWSSFRVVGNIILVIGLLVIVFGQSLGGGLIDAYTAKKVFPRIIAAAILTNLSVYLVAIAVDVSNIAGSGISQLMFAPFKASGMANFELTGTQTAVGVAPLAFMGTMLGVFVSGAATTASVGGFLAALGGVIGGALPFILLFVILPAALILLAIFVVLALRRALILFLVMIAPIAFALYVLPNTEKYFKKWWEFLSKALLVYPIVAALFALADIMAITMLTASNANNSNFAENGVAILVAFALQLIPLAAIPFSFKLAGGILGNLYGTLAGMGKKGSEALKGNANDPNSLRNRTRRDMGKHVTDLRAAVQSDAHGNTKRRTRFNRGLRNMVGGGPGVFVKQAQNTEESAKRIEAATNYGNDIYNKAATIPLSQLDNWERTGHRYNRAKRTFIAADGTEVTRAQVESAHKYFNTLADKTANFKYTLGKTETLTQDQQERALSDYLQIANDNGQSLGNTIGGWSGIAIPNKNMALYLRRRSIKQAGKPTVDANGNVVPTVDANGNVVRPGQIYDAGVSHGSLVTDVAAQAPHKLVEQTEGTFRALEEAIRVQAGSADAAERTKAQEAFDNLHVYTQGAMGAAAAGGPAAAAAATAAAAAGGPAPAGAGGLSGYSSSGSAAAKNAAAAKLAYQNLVSAGFTPTPPPSDRRLKKNIKLLGTSRNGIQLYEFSYLWSDVRYVGVMAQDLLETHPEAVLTDAHGYYAVDYTKLGLRMMSAAEYAHNAHAIYLETVNR